MNGEGTKRERKKRRELGGPMQVMWFAPLSFYSGRLLYIFSALLFIKQKQDILPRESSGKEEEKDGLTADSFQRFLLQFPDTVSTDSGCLLLGPSAPAALDNIGLDSCQPKSSLLVWQHSLFLSFSLSTNTHKSASNARSFHYTTNAIWREWRVSFFYNLQ
jgi:hypothetical protein